MPSPGPSTERSRPSHLDRVTWAIVAGGAVLLVGMLLYLAGRPLDTNDMWWHLSMGELYADEGPWPAGDPILFTAHDDAPVQQEWGFSVLTHVVRSIGGFTALRVAHAIAVLAILWIVFRLFEFAASHERSGDGERSRDDASAERARFMATAAVALYVVLSWWRLFQLRSDLFSIPATFVFVWLAFGQRPGDAARFSWGRVGQAVALVWVWANVHSLFGIALALLVAALCGALLQTTLTTLRPPASAPALPSLRPRVLEWGAMLGGGVLASAVHPRGFQQIATFFTVSRDFAIWRVRDDWLPFDPFGFAHYDQSSMTFFTWVWTDFLLLAFVVTSATALYRYLRAPSPRRLARFNPVFFGLGLAGCAAFLVSVRFIWMAALPIAFVLRQVAMTNSLRWAHAGRIGAAVAVIAMAAWFPTLGGFARDAADPQRYLARHYSTQGYAGETVRFLRASGASGRVFNAYPLGGFMGFWLRPGLRLFIDSRTEHYEAEIVREYSAVNRLRSTRPNESMLGLLDRRGVDFFVGTGLPGPHDEQDWQSYTTQHLQGAPGWLTVFRNFEQHVWLRVHPRNDANLVEIERFWADQGVPFDRRRGFDAAEIIRTKPELAVEWRLVPAAFERWQVQRTADAPATRGRAANLVGLSLHLAGAYVDQIDVDRALVAERPGALPARRRIVAALLRLGRDDEAIEAARQLAAHSTSPGDDRFLETALAVTRIDDRAIPEGARAAVRLLLEQAHFQERTRLLTPLPVMTRREIAQLVRPFEGEAMQVQNTRPD